MAVQQLSDYEGTDDTRGQSKRVLGMSYVEWY